MDHLFSCVTLDVIGYTMFSVDFESVLSGDNLFAQSLMIYLEEVTQKNLNFLHPYLHPTSSFRVARAAKYMTDFVDSVVSGRVAERTKEEYNPSQAKDLLDLLLDAHEPTSGVGLTKQEVTDQVMTFLIAGHETTAHTCSFTIAMLARHPHVLAKVREEIHRVLGPVPAKMTYDDMHKFPYLTAVIKEVLRMYPAAPEPPRLLKEDTVIRGHKIPKGTRLILGLLAIHYSEQIWDRPNTFDPDRFLHGGAGDENDAGDSGGRGLYNYMPFGFGRRSCIGQSFVLLELRIILTTLLQHFDFAHIPIIPLSVKQVITLKPKDGLMMTVWPYSQQQHE